MSINVIRKLAKVKNSLPEFKRNYKDIVNANKGYVSNYYLSLDEMLKGIEPVLFKHGLFLKQEVKTICNKAGNTSGVETVIVDVETGEEYRTGLCPIPKNALKGTPSNGTMLVQDNGAGITYIKRSQIASLFGISPDNEDSLKIKKRNEKLQLEADKEETEKVCLKKNIKRINSFVTKSEENKIKFLSFMKSNKLKSVSELTYSLTREFIDGYMQ